ncbi:MAG TPA: hypothetical protein VNG69_01720 [Casimicrobiaceae bacterium]|nr:hypothetical protein [Casimicrobiaceae bacterium]
MTTTTPPSNAAISSVENDTTVQPVSGARMATRLATVFAVALAIAVLGYLAIAVPGRWFGASPPQSWGPKDLQATKGTARIVGDELHVLPADASGIAVVSVNTQLKSIDYAAIEWIAIDVPEHIDVSLLWRTDFQPNQIQSMPLTVVTGRLLRVVTRDHPAWIGKIEGLALAMRGPMAEPVRIRGVLAKTLSAGEVLRDRMREWFAFEAWNGASINTVTGGADLQDLPLPVLLAAAVLLATLIVIALKRLRPRFLPVGVLTSLVGFVLVAWLVLDARWMLNLMRQVDATAERFSGKTAADKRLAVEDGALFAFVQKAKQALPDAPARIYVAADSAYFRQRAAYHLYPHNAFAPRTNTLPEPSQIRSGDWIAVYLRKGVQYDAANQKLRWDNKEPLTAEMKASSRGAALFLVR